MFYVIILTRFNKIIFKSIST